MQRVSRFVRLLAETGLGDNALNPWARCGPASNEIRRANLRTYLEWHLDQKSRVVLVGEAPSWRGCAKSGIPFVSESLLARGVIPPDRYRIEAGGPTLATEASASIVWETFAALAAPPVLWNAFPFHPFKPGNPQSNRAPKAEELKLGAAILRKLLRLTGASQVVAVGRHAGTTLASLGIAHETIRHPSHGGKSAFQQGVFRLCR